MFRLKPLILVIFIAVASLLIIIFNENAVSARALSRDETKGVLGAQYVMAQGTPTPVTVTESKQTDAPKDTSLNNKNVYKYYFIAGAVAFVALVVWLLIAQRR